LGVLFCGHADWPQRHGGTEKNY